MFTPITLDKARNFRYGMKALSLIEKKFKKNLSAVEFEKLTIEEIMTVVWAGLVHEDSALTVDKLIGIIDDCEIPLENIVKTMSEALNSAFKKSNDDEELWKQARIRAEQVFDIHDNSKNILAATE